MGRRKIFSFTDTYKLSEKLILRDHLALQRTKLANERTLLTYIRSALYLIIAGIAFNNVTEFEQVPYLGLLCFISSGILFFVGILRYVQLRIQIDKMYKEAFKED